MGNHEDDNFKKMVESMYNQEQKPKKPKKSDDKAPSIRKRPNIVKPEDITPHDQDLVDFSVEKALEEMELIRHAYLDMQESIAELAIFPFIFRHIEGLAEILLDLTMLIKNNMPEGEISDETKARLDDLHALRAKILSAEWQKYGQGGNK